MKKFVSTNFMYDYRCHNLLMAMGW